MKSHCRLSIATAAIVTVQFGNVLAWASDEVPVFAQDDPARLWINNNKLHYYGSISQNSVVAFERFVDTNDTADLDGFVINSLGGDTISGRTIGRWIDESALDVEVDAICFSSCANYIFSAGRSKTIRANSFVGWHGSERQFEVIAQSTPGQTGDDLERAALRKALLPVLPDHSSSQFIDRAVDQQIEIAKKSRTDEEKFFAQIGVAGEFTLHGLRPENIDKWRQTGRAGWTYSLADMQRLGLGSVAYLGDGDYVKSSQVQKNVYVLSYDPSLVKD